MMVIRPFVVAGASDPFSTLTSVTVSQEPVVIWVCISSNLTGIALSYSQSMRGCQVNFIGAKPGISFSPTAVGQT